MHSTEKIKVKKHTLLALLAALSLATHACGKGGEAAGASSADDVSGGSSSQGGEAVPHNPVHRTGSGSVEATVGPAGGTLELSGGARVEIPPGAVEDEQTFVLKEAPMTTAFFNQEAERPVGETFLLSPFVEAPEGRTITVSIPLASYPEGWGDVAIAYEYPMGERVGAEDSQHTRWQYERAKLSGGRAVAELPALVGYRLQFVLSNLEVQ